MLDKLEIFRDYGSNLFANTPNIDNFLAGRLETGATSFSFSSSSTYSAWYRKTKVYPESIVVAYNGTFQGDLFLTEVMFPYPNSFKCVKVDDDDVSIPGFDHTARYTIGNGIIRKIFEESLYVLGVRFTSTGIVNKLAFYFDGDTSTETKIAPLNTADIYYPKRVWNNAGFYPKQYDFDGRYLDSNGDVFVAPDSSIYRRGNIYTNDLVDLIRKNSLDKDDSYISTGIDFYRAGKVFSSGHDLIQNGSFDSGIDGWSTSGGADIAWTGSSLFFKTTVESYCYTNFGLTQDRGSYNISFDCQRLSGDGEYSLRILKGVTPEEVFVFYPDDKKRTFNFSIRELDYGLPIVQYRFALACSGTGEAIFDNVSMNVNSTGGTLLITFDKIEEELSRADKVVLRVRARNTNYNPLENRQNSISCEVFPKPFNTNIKDDWDKITKNWSNNSARERIAVGDSVVVSSTDFQNYDIDLDFIDPFKPSDNKYLADRKYDVSSLLNDAIFSLFNFVENIDISSVELFVYRGVDEALLMSLPCNVSFFEGEVSRFEDFTGGVSPHDDTKFNSNFSVSSRIHEIFDGAFYDFREGQGAEAYSVDGNSMLRYFDGELGDYSDFQWSSYYRDINPFSNVYKNAVRSSGTIGTTFRFNNQPDLAGGFTLYLNISPEIFDSLSYNFSDSPRSILFSHGDEFKREIEISHLPDQRFTLTVENHSYFPNRFYLDASSLSPEEGNIELILICERVTGSNYNILFINNNTGQSISTYTEKYTSVNSVTDLFGNRWMTNNWFSRGYLNSVGLIPRVITSEELTDLQNASKKQGLLYNGFNEGGLKYSEIEKNLDIKGRFNNTGLFDDNNFSIDTRSYAYNNIVSNPDGLSVEYKFDNYTTKPVSIYGEYTVAGTQGNSQFLYSGEVPTGRNKRISLKPYKIVTSDVNKGNYSFDFLTVNMTTQGSGQYDLDLKLKDVSVKFDSWKIPLTGFDDINLYTSGEPTSSSSIDLYLYSNYATDSVDLYTKGTEVGNSTIDFSLLSEAAHNNIDLYLQSNEIADDSLPFYLASNLSISSGLDMFTKAIFEDNHAFNMILSGSVPEVINNNLSLFTKSSSDPSLYSNIDMYLASDIEFDNVLNMFMKSDDSKNNTAFNMFLEGTRDSKDAINLFLFNDQDFYTKNIPLFLAAHHSGIQEQFPMVIGRDHEGLSSSLSFFMASNQVEQEDIDMFLKNAGVVSTSRLYKRISDMETLTMDGEELLFEGDPIVWGSGEGYYLRPDGVSLYRVPDGISMFIQGSGTDGTTINLFTHGY